MKLNARELRDLEEKNAMGEIPQIKRNPIYFILENIYDTYNIGGLFRLADALAIEKIYLCGQTETPPNHKIKKASVGTYKVVQWQYCKSTKHAIDDLKSKFQNPCLAGRQANIKSNPNFKIQNEKKLRVTSYELRVIAVEQHKNSIPYTQAQYQYPLALIFGNESFGITPETLKLADQIVEIPMWGINKSLNVIVSAAIVSYWVISHFSAK